MFAANIGDLAQAVLLRRQVNTANVTLNNLTEELASGRVNDLQTHLRGEFTPLTGIERSLKLQETLTNSNANVRQFAASQQIALEQVQNMLQGTAADFIGQGNIGTPPSINATVLGAVDKFETIVGALNTSYAGRALFAGTATQSRALADHETLLAELEAAVVAAGATTANEVVAAVDAWFDTPGGGFETNGYLGATESLAPFNVGEGAQVRLDVRADDPSLRETVKNFATIALLDRGILADDVTGQRALLSITGDRMLTLVDGVTTLRANIGFTEQLIEEAQIQTDAQNAVLIEAREALIGADPYEVSVRLQEVQTQVEMLYTITGRLSQLTLSNYLR